MGQVVYYEGNCNDRIITIVTGGVGSPGRIQTAGTLGGSWGMDADGLSSLVALLRYNACIHQCFDRRTKGAGNMVNGLAGNAEIDDSSNCDATVVLLKKGNQGEPVPRK